MNNPKAGSTTIRATAAGISGACALLAIVAMALAPAASAQVYRIVDDEGNVTYTDTPPAGVESEEVAPADEANIVDSPDTVEERTPDWIKANREERAEAEEAAREAHAEKLDRWRDQVDAAEDALAKAEDELAEGRELREGDYVGNAGGGARPSADYLQRVRMLEQQVEDAREALKSIRRDKPRK